MYIRVFLVDPEMSSHWIVWYVNVGLVMTRSTQSRSLRAAYRFIASNNWIGFYAVSAIFYPYRGGKAA